MTTVAVTGATGKTGRVVVTGLLEHGIDVLAVDVAVSAAARAEFDALGVPLTRADLTDYGQAVDALAGADSVIHLANIPAPGLAPAAHTLTTNTAMNDNVFLAAARLKLSRVVWASSETTLGLPFDVPPRYAPVDEDHYPYPTTTYALSKVAGETTAAHIAEWSGIPFVALRLSNVHTPEDYARVPGYWADARSRRWNLWGYVDARDVAAACRQALTAPVTGAQSFVIAAADTIMNRPSAELLAEVFPGVRLTREIGTYETLLGIDRAREVLGYQPQHSWRDAVDAT
ncbi:NAD-dependent epimerase/dehydratase family protein [Actinacidiphila bryophytorum]|uniref:UDP-glucose 4-epimerase n=1 Tax=Actinacidiphila bryophytorum TaxID=1436133 RepID=A0A9W4E773_9ACTN|nr:NAD(P)-dependent oxidoreductase [Actinacidiphila bryophytorum]MBM9436361.1 NAD(P)-dependent oxidoreductase [Actinacidiphila bryophytorum]MBN6547946.1 NAD(P)-dependent oxidoreductase [Actinacidiphila bryophytorum]CAG7631283.1 UDP-glucose 4-epimerase [Actinacidiphila bryophytorum]